MTARIRDAASAPAQPPPSAMRTSEPLGFVLFGLGSWPAVVVFATHHSEEMDFAQLVLHAAPAWLLIAVLLQMGTYVTDARIWEQVLVRAGISRPLRSYVGLSLAKLFMDQAIPSVGLSGTLLVIRALTAGACRAEPAWPRWSAIS